LQGTWTNARTLPVRGRPWLEVTAEIGTKPKWLIPLRFFRIRGNNGRVRSSRGTRAFDPNATFVNGRARSATPRQSYSAGNREKDAINAVVMGNFYVELSESDRVGIALVRVGDPPTPQHVVQDYQAPRSYQA
jgi:hypothetical protein